MSLDIYFSDEGQNSRALFIEGLISILLQIECTQIKSCHQANPPVSSIMFFTRVGFVISR